MKHCNSEGPEAQKLWLAQDALALQVATPQMMINYAKLLEGANFWERAFKVYERGVSLFRWPQVKDLWLLYLSKFVDRCAPGTGIRAELATEIHHCY